ncbi:MAG: isoprenylcysteine carboxylmethyltransferase family protein [Ectothiorhodospiraceae bacterium]
MHRYLPPPVVMLAAAGLMALVAWLTPALALTMTDQTRAAVLVAALGVGILVWAAVTLTRAGTTVNPTRPESSTQLVTHGLFAESRNPVYLADSLFLVAWAVYLGHPLAVLLIPVFMAVIQRWQIVPEERALEERFGPAFRSYRDRVPRWL